MAAPFITTAETKASPPEGDDISSVLANSASHEPQVCRDVLLLMKNVEGRVGLPLPHHILSFDPALFGD